MYLVHDMVHLKKKDVCELLSSVIPCACNRGEDHVITDSRPCLQSHMHAMTALTRRGVWGGGGEEHVKGLHFDVVFWKVLEHKLT